MAENKMFNHYKVFVDDNYHYMDEGERYAVGSYHLLEDAIEKCKEITIRSLENLIENEITPEKLSAQKAYLWIAESKPQPIFD
jgi:hypothetical protein